jgi:hypothetical protein
MWAKDVLTVIGQSDPMRTGRDRPPSRMEACHAYGLHKAHYRVDCGKPKWNHVRYSAPMPIAALRRWGAGVLLLLPARRERCVLDGSKPLSAIGWHGSSRSCLSSHGFRLKPARNAKARCFRWRAFGRRTDRPYQGCAYSACEIHKRQAISSSAPTMPASVSACSAAKIANASCPTPTTPPRVLLPCSHSFNRER